MGTEQTAEFYTGDKYMRPDIYIRYEPIYLQAISFLPHPNECPRILDLGCGVGHFAKLVRDRGYSNYIGIDFSTKMLKKARANVPELEFVKRDLTLSIYDNDRLFVLLEVLEHIKDDIVVIENISIGSQVIFSVPTFDARSHVRTFKNTGAVIKRYKHLLRFDKIVQIPWGETNKVFMFSCERI
jgi:SAM-dependent methyltransferase